MSDQEVFIFGSFTEDETRLYQSKLVENVVPPVENTTLQFGSLDFASLSSLKGFSAESGRLNSSTKPKENVASHLVTKDTQSMQVKVPSAICNVLQKVPGSESNGNTNDCSSLNSGFNGNGNGNTTVGISSSYISEVPNGNGELLTSPEVQDKFEISTYTNVHDNSLKAVLSSEDFGKISSTPAPVVANLLPRGLINLGNLCFLNATLQALLSCSPFVQLLQDLRSRNIPKVGYPALHAFVEFISVFDMPNNSSLKKNERTVRETGKPFSPIMFDSVVKKFTPDLPIMSGRPRQEDAQEFLSFVMDLMHDELLKLGGNFPTSNCGRLSLILSAEDDGWETVGQKNKSAVTRTQTFMPSELSAIFGGQLRSVVKAKGNKASATVQPFLLLHLDIFLEAVHTIEDALHLFSAPEALEDYKTSSGKAGVVSASKSVKIQALSKIMILHLMRFSYGSKGSTKLHKPISFPLELVLGRELLVSPSAEGRRYELVATITHHGRDPTKGHYTADTRNPDGQWLRYDDASVIPVSTSSVLHEQAYVLFYRQL